MSKEARSKNAGISLLKKSLSLLSGRRWSFLVNCKNEPSLSAEVQSIQAGVVNPRVCHQHLVNYSSFQASPAGADRAILPTVSRAHVIVWRKHIEVRAVLSPRRSVTSSRPCAIISASVNAIAFNPFDRFERQVANGNEGSAPALGDAQARKLLDAVCPRKPLNSAALLPVQSESQLALSCPP
jgi:hypothetical protein